MKIYPPHFFFFIQQCLERGKAMVTNVPNVKRVMLMIAIYAILLGVMAVPAVLAEHRSEKQGPYLVIDGAVSRIEARSLVIDGQQYPISIFARVFMGSIDGKETSLQLVVNVGKIDQARLYVLGGKVEKIVVLKII